jgi:hypothetical protein
MAVADFVELRERGYFYADKTELLHRLVTTGWPYFLSRPRRFGKTLLVSTLEAILQGRGKLRGEENEREVLEATERSKKLFKGLWIDGSDYDWTPTPVIHLDMLSVSTASVTALNLDLKVLLRRIAKTERLRLIRGSPSMAFQSLIEDLHSKHGRKPAILIDEYDAPILAKIAQPKLAKDIREAMGEFYAALKAAERWRGFTFITGVTKLAKLSIFSKLNNLTNLSLDPDFAAICGLTMDEFDAFVEDQLTPPENVAGWKSPLKKYVTNRALPAGASADDLKARILAKYDGYSWDGETRLLNPWSVLNSFLLGRLANFWFESGSTKFLDDLAGKDFRLFQIFRSGAALDDDANEIDIGGLNPMALLFQAGYLTVDRIDKDSDDWKYRLRFPNVEVEASMYRLALGWEAALDGMLLLRQRAEAMRDSLERLDAAGFQKTFSAIIGSLPRVPRPNEAHFRTILLMALGAAGQSYEAEGQSGDGFFDVHLQTPGGADFVIEMKHVRGTDPENGAGAGEMSGETVEAGAPVRFRERMRKAAEKAMAQIEDRKYDLKFQGKGNKIYKVALVIGRRNDVLVEIRKADNWRLARNDEGLLEVVDDEAD